MVSVAVTDAELRHALTIARSLGGDEVTAFGRARFSTAFFSKFTAKHRIFREYGELDLRGFDVAFLVTDEANRFGVTKRLRNALLPGRKNWERFRDKSRTVKFAKRHKVPVPETHVMHSFHDDWDYPVYVKPLESSGSRGGRLVRDKFEMGRVGPGLLGIYGRLMVQEVVKRKATVGVEMLYHKGKLKALFQHRRIREHPASGGPSTMRVSVNFGSTKRFATKLMKKARWNGVAMAEFALTEEGPVLLEVNPRWWGSLALARKAGVDFPRIYRDIVVEGDAAPVTDYESGVVCKYFLFGDVMHFAERKAPLGFLASLPETTNFDILSLHDPLPGLARFPLAFEMLLDPGLRHRYLSR